MHSVAVTGVSTGIGWGITKVLTQNGFRVFGSVRKTEDAERLSKEFGEAFVPLIFDVTDQDAVQGAARQVRDQLHGETLFGLVNNAGVAVPAPLLYQPIDNFRYQLEVNLISVLIVRQAFLPCNFISRLIPMLLPKRLADRMIARNLGFKRGEVTVTAKLKLTNKD